MAGARVCLGQIGAAHGVRGEVRLCSFTADPAAITDYGPLRAEDGRVFEIDIAAAGQGSFRGDAFAASPTATPPSGSPIPSFTCRATGCREPTEPDEFYHADLIGLAVVDRAGQRSAPSSPSTISAPAI